MRLYLRAARDFAGRSDFHGLLRQISRAAYSDTLGIVVRKDLTGGQVSRDRGGRPKIRHATVEDLRGLLAADRDPQTDAGEVWERWLRRYVLETMGVDGCYVAEVGDKGPSFMQYLFTSEDNGRLQAIFPGLFPVLASDSALVEFLYVAPDARTPGLAVDCLLQVAAEAQRKDATSVVSYIEPANKGALFVNHLAGFQASGVRRGKRRLLRTTYAFDDWPTDASTSLSDVASGKVAIA